MPPHCLTHHHWTRSPFALLISGSFFYLPFSSQISWKWVYLARDSFCLHFRSLLPGCWQISLQLKNCLELQLVWLCHISVQIGGLILFIVFPSSSFTWSHLLFSQCVKYPNFIVKGKAKQSPFFLWVGKVQMWESRVIAAIASPTCLAALKPL